MKHKNKRILAVVVTFYPTEICLENLDVLSRQVDKILYVDNTENGPKHFQEKGLLSLLNHPKTSVIFNNQNLGIATALNQGLEQSIAEGYEFVITLDQDSTVTPMMIPELLKVFEHKNQENILAACPVFKDKNTGHLTTHQSSEEIIYEIQATLTSGMLLRTQLVQKLGFFKDDYFIYHVDTEFCLRAKIKGFKIFENSKAVLLHAEGRQTRRPILWKKNLIVTNHSPVSIYYMSRNLILMCKNYPSQVLFIAKIFESYFRFHLKIILVENQKAKKLFYSLVGFLHGFIGIKGKIKF